MSQFTKQHTKRLIAPICLLLFTITFFSCASVSNYSNDKSIGFEHFAPKYYLVIETAKGGGRTVKVLTLPDMSNPRYVKYEAGWGKVDFNFKLTNGVLSEYGQKSDVGGPEAVTALAALGTAYGGILAGEAAKITAEAAIGARPGTLATLTLDILKTSADNLQTKVVDILESRAEDFFKDIHTQVKGLIIKLRGAAVIQLKADTQILDEITKRQKDTKSIIKDLETEEKKLTTYLGGLPDPTLRGLGVNVQTALSDEIKRLRKFAFPTIKLEMYEIVSKQDGSIEFRKVELN